MLLWVCQDLFLLREHGCTLQYLASSGPIYLIFAVPALRVRKYLVPQKVELALPSEMTEGWQTMREELEALERRLQQWLVPVDPMSFEHRFGHRCLPLLVEYGYVQTLHPASTCLHRPGSPACLQTWPTLAAKGFVLPASFKAYIEQLTSTEGTSGLQGCSAEQQLS